jgi:HAD superfamily hydrolase (TIGR01459 family)
MNASRFVDGIGGFADRYRGFIIDQWGVLHDGTAVYPGAPEAIAELKRRGKRMVLLSNSGRRAAFNQARLQAMGVNLADFDAVITSGEAAWRLLRHRDRPPFSELGRRCFLLTYFGDLTVVEGLGLELVDDVAAADFIFATGLDSPPKTLDDYRWMAEAAARHKLPMICSNPDRVAVSRDAMATAPGAVAALYEAMGGEVHYIGKPHRPIYQACLDALQGLAPVEIVALGDSLEHDIKGANDAGIASCFVTGGIHAASFPPEAAPDAHRRQLDRLGGPYHARPDWVVPRLAW